MFKKNNREANTRTVAMKVALMGGGQDKNGREYDRSTLLNILVEIDFSKISIPVYTYKKLAFGDDKKGTFAIGYVKGFNAENETFDLMIYNNNAETVKSFENAVVFPRMFIDKLGEVKTILSLDVVPANYFE